MATHEEFADALRDAVAELASVHHRIPLPDGRTDLELRVMTSIAAGLLDALPAGVGPGLLRHLGEAAARDSG